MISKLKALNFCYKKLQLQKFPNLFYPTDTQFRQQLSTAPALVHSPSLCSKTPGKGVSFHLFFKFPTFPPRFHGRLGPESWRIHTTFSHIKFLLLDQNVFKLKVLEGKQRVRESLEKLTIFLNRRTAQILCNKK